MEKDNYEVGQNNHAPKVPRHGPGRGMRPGEKAKNFKGTWAKLLTNCKKYWGAMIFAIICAGIGTVLTLIGPDKLSKMTDLITEGVMTGIDMDGIKRIGITLICFYGCSALLSLVQNLIMGYVTQQVSKGLRSNISRKINRLPMWFYNQTSTGDVLSRVTNDVDTIAQSFNQSMGNLVTAVTLLLGSLIMMIKTNIIMTVAAILSTLLGFVFMTLIMSKSQKYFARQQMHLGEINGHVEEIYAGHTVVKAYNGEKKSKEKFDKMNENLRDSAFKAQCLSGLMMPLMTFIGNLGYVAVCIVGALLVMNDKISFGVIIAFMMYVRYFTQPLSQIAQAMQALQAYPGGMQIGGGITAENAAEYLEEGASHVIVTSYVFQDGQVRYDRLDRLKKAVGKEHLVLDLSCRRRENSYYIVTNRWQTFTEVRLIPEVLEELSGWCDEFLVHGVDVEGKASGTEEDLVRMLAAWNGLPITYAGGIGSMEDLREFARISGEKLDYTIGSALDLFGGKIPYAELTEPVK